MKINIKHIIFCIPVLFGAGIFFSCENDLENVKKITASDETPDQVTTNLHSFYSDSGIVKYEIIASRVEIYEKEPAKTIFKNGFEVNYFSGSGEIISKLQADYGEIKEKENMVIARNNVIFTNYEKKQELKTEELFWDKNLKKVRTTKNFFLKTPTTEGKGTGMETDETFSEYEVYNFSATYKDTTNESSKTE